jgi:hypothetical protein
MELKKPFNFYTKVYFEIFYVTTLIPYVQHIGQSSNMKGVFFYKSLWSHHYGHQ